jgi:hypothetical protein
MYDPNANANYPDPLPRRTPKPRPPLIPYSGTPTHPRPVPSPRARGTAGASARAEAARQRAALAKSVSALRWVEIAYLTVILGWFFVSVTLAHYAIGHEAIDAVAALACMTAYGWYARRSHARKRTAADRWEQGAKGEEATARLLAPLLTEGWHILHDRRLPGGNANVDHLLVTPDGRKVLVLDTKSWQQRSAPVTAAGGTLYYGAQNQTRTLDTVRWEASKVRDGLDIITLPVIAVHGARVDRSPLHLGDVTIASTTNLLDVLRTFSAGYKGGRPPNRDRAKALADRAALRFPAYVTR